MPPKVSDEEEYEEEFEEEEEEEEVAGGAEEEEEEEEEEEDAGPADDSVVSTPWAGLSSLPEREEVTDLLGELAAAGRSQLTVLLLGKSGVGKSSLVNAFLGEALARVMAFKLQADTDTSTAFVKHAGDDAGRAAGFRVKFIDTCGLEDPEAGDTINYAALSKIAGDVGGQPIDVVLYVDRLDLYRVDPLDRSALRAIGNVFGGSVWKRTVLVLTHGGLATTPPGTDFGGYASQRVRALRRAVPAGRGPFFRPELPAVLVENSAECATDPSGRRVLPDSSVWMQELAATLVDVALKSRPYVYRPSLTRRPNRSWRWAVPLLAAGQAALWLKVLKPVMDKDEERLAQQDEFVWRAKGIERQRLGIGPPLRPSKENAWRLEQMYEDD